MKQNIIETSTHRHLLISVHPLVLRYCQQAFVEYVIHQMRCLDANSADVND